ncbi:hypothetical protein HanRHA438_Chr08g0368971 [Helianthus annuus]|nr:hypothetical protein HanHA300_Chr08g0294711 [Helianthus annuus]KAJ0554873.1 hypothetical protein HanHA89_Chr08g0313241 [Helianthus annuus]KAJ0720436.1 hypothetical protein HanLR1_Chr08g0293541 [Helianthus annuus]KAJ0899471.1 hypothetical protein HanRHA438_Chr08g0368971 [Helianthus annuus]
MFGYGFYYIDAFRKVCLLKMMKFLNDMTSSQGWFHFCITRFVNSKFSHPFILQEQDHLMRQMHAKGMLYMHIQVFYY